MNLSSLLATGVASGSLLLSTCSSNPDSNRLTSPQESPIGHYVLPAHGNVSFSRPELSEGAPFVSTETPLESMLEFFETTSLSEEGARNLLNSQNIQWGISKPATLRFVSDSFIYGNSGSPDDPEPVGSYTRSDLTSVERDLVNAIVSGRRPSVEFYPIKGGFETITRGEVKAQQPVHPIYIVPGDLVAQPTNAFSSGERADVHTYNRFFVENVKQLAERPTSARNLNQLLVQAQERGPIGRHTRIGAGKFRTYNFLEGAYGVVVNGEGGTEHVYAVSFNGPRLLYPSLTEREQSPFDTLSKLGVDGSPAYCGHKVDVRSLK